jgi:PAS domain S-box-containing protein
MSRATVEATEALVITITVLHDIIEATGFLHDSGLPYFVPVSLYLVPVVYAALTFGLAGALATALLATVITTPNFIFWHHGLERLGVIFQMLIVVTVAYFLGRRVDRERSASQQAEATGTALRTSETKYRGLLESSPVAILVSDHKGNVLEANPAASILFGRNKATLESMRIADLVGTVGAEKLLGASQNGGQPDFLTLKSKEGLDLYIEPSRTEVDDGQGSPVIQVLFRDVTEEHHRQAGLRAYAAHVTRAQEEERQRIARELHDETIQTLVLLCRQLDSIDGGSESLAASQTDSVRKARRTAEEIVQGLRDFSKALRPPILDDLGMMASVRRLLTDFTERTKIEGKLKVAGGERRLPPDVELGLYRITQEALWNIERHAGATCVAVAITFSERKVRLEVVDNGAGFSVPLGSSDFTTSGHLGLISMQERAELLGGKLEIRSSPRKGTGVIVFVPVTDVIGNVSD